MDDLYTRLLTGEAQAWHELYTEISPGLYRFLVSRVSDHSIAQDLMQEGFYRLSKNLRDIQKSQALKAWLYSTCYRLAVDWHRQHRITDPIGSIISSETGVSDPLRDLVQHERDEAIRQAVMDLSDSHRDVVILRIWGELSYAEIQDITGLSEGTLRSQFHWAIRKLKRALVNHGDLVKEVNEQ